MYTLGVGFVSTCLVTPIYSIGLTLFYLDARVRKEGFDIEWLLRKSRGLPTNPDGAPSANPALG